MKNLKTAISDVKEALAYFEQIKAAVGRMIDETADIASKRAAVMEEALELAVDAETRDRLSFEYAIAMEDVNSLQTASNAFAYDVDLGPLYEVRKHIEDAAAVAMPFREWRSYRDEIETREAAAAIGGVRVVVGGKTYICESANDALALCVREANTPRNSEPLPF